VRAQPLQMFGGGTAAPIEQDATVSAGTTTDVTLELSRGTLLVVTVNHAQPLATIEYFLVPGTAQLTLAELNQRRRAGTILDTLFGGQDLDRPMQFHDLTPGTYTLCIDQQSKQLEHLPLDCRTVAIRGDQPVVELGVQLP
jgi:hypothetical protein